MRAVFLCRTSASILTRSTSTLTTSADDSGVGVRVFAFNFLLGVCEMIGLAEEKSRAARTIEVNRKRGSRIGRRFLISFVIQMQVSRISRHNLLSSSKIVVLHHENPGGRSATTPNACSSATPT